jgi:hypothetical protein
MMRGRIIEFSMAVMAALSVCYIVLMSAPRVLDDSLKVLSTLF